MAMTKAEKAEFEQMRRERERHRVTRYYDYVPAPLTVEELAKRPKVTIQKGTHWPKEVTEVYFANDHTMTVTRGYTTGHSHCRSATDLNSWSQGPGGGFATETDAWNYIRHWVSKRAADALIKIDEQSFVAYAKETAEKHAANPD